MNKYLKTLKIFFSWRIVLLVVTLFFVPFKNTFQVFSNFDGLQFINIAKEGYGTPNTYYSYLLFPLYPQIIKILSGVLGYLGSSLFIAHLFALGSLYLFQQLALLDYPKASVQRSLKILLLFPASFFLVSAYSESLFLFLCLSSVYLSRKQHYLLSALVAALATYTRLAGLILWVMIITEFYLQHRHTWKSFFKPNVLYLLIPPLGALTYLRYLQVNQGNLQRFMLSLPNKFIFLHQVIFRYLKMLVFVDHTSYLFLVVFTECLVSLFALFLIIISFKKLRPSYWLYFFLSFFIPTLWGSFVSMPRYLLVVFPLFFFLGDWLERQHPYVQKIYYVLSVCLLFVSFGLFVNGIFVG